MPRIPNKPSFPNLTPENLKKTLDKVSKAVEEATSADGEVSLDDVAAKLTGDDAALSTLDAIRREDAFERTETRTSVSCGGDSSTREVRVAPESLQGAEVRSVLTALIAAKSDLDAVDSNADGRISIEEAEVNAGDTLSANLADAVVGEHLGTFESEMDNWAYAIRNVKNDLQIRTGSEVRIEQAARHHTSSSDAAEAVAWSFREMLSKGMYVSVDLLEGELAGAETSWLRFVPLWNEGGPGHLSDNEVKRFLGTDDLRAFAADKKAELETKVGMSWSDFLAGKDIDGIDQIDDPDVATRTSSRAYGC